MLNPAETFEPYRRRLLGLAYRMLGSMADSEDAVQDTYVRWHGADRDKVSDPRAFLMTTTTRICLDMLTSARARREEYVGPWLPEPIVDTAALAPDSHTELAEDLSIALLLTRAVDNREVAAVLPKTAAAMKTWKGEGAPDAVVEFTHGITFRSSARARWIRDPTVPGRQPRADAISASLLPCQKRNTMAARWR